MSDHNFAVNNRLPTDSHADNLLALNKAKSSKRLMIIYVRRRGHLWPRIHDFIKGSTACFGNGLRDNGSDEYRNYSRLSLLLFWSADRY
jgi:hypothetical protein